MMKMKPAPEQGPLRYVKGGTLIDGTGRAAIADAVIVIRDGKFELVKILGQ